MADMHLDEDTAPPLSNILPIGYSCSPECGYCRNSRQSQSPNRYSYYAVATSLTPAFYQSLVDRCWRRSGTLLYRPNQKDSCCPHYTLRLDSTQFKPTKDQRQAINRFNRHVIGEAYAKEAARTHPLSREEARKRDNEFDLVARIAEPELRSLQTPPQPSHEFTVTLEEDMYTDEKFDLFENYQRLVHHEPPDKISRGSFKRFLCSSTVTRGAMVGDNGKKRMLGSYHMCYRLDGKLVAMGVLDLLPDCVSAVYFLYHESIRSFQPGKLGALREIAFALEHGYRWWYSGFYIHSCPKMRYKVDYSPQYVLDPETLEWDLLDREALAIFDDKPYVSLSRERREREEGRTRAEKAEELSAPEQGGEKKTEADGKDNKDAASDNDTLFGSGMPGIPTLAEMEALDMGNVLIRSDFSDSPFVASQLVVWETETIHGRSLKARIAELVAAIGPPLMDQYCVDFRKGSRDVAGY
ncbi:arginine-tRNA-protein transferase [Podospora conica]|nr:arginine-tRNA-protein transferase [Schizothecium conicum]